jgi:protein phosphatase 1L
MASAAAAAAPSPSAASSAPASSTPSIPLSWLLVIIGVTLYILLYIRRVLINQKLPQHAVPHFERTRVNVGPAAGVHSIQGRRAHMEDTYQAAVDIGGDAKRAFYGVFDGHGGQHASEYTAEHLHRIILQQKYDESPGAALRAGFKQLDAEWLQLADRNDWDDGTTAIAVLIHRRTLYVSNVGDSRAVLCSAGRAIAMSSDHKPAREDEKKRIERLGGRIIHYGTWRVEGVLAVTRAIGDRKLKTFVTATPEIHERHIQRDDEFLVLATDGVWDVLSSQDSCDIVKSVLSAGGSPADAARKLTNAAYERGSMDNITSLVVDINHYR